jgi:hypothetical protein
MPPDLTTTRTYYWTWQGCALCAATASGAGVSFAIWLSTGSLGYVTGVIAGLCAMQAWQETKWSKK